MPEQAPREDIAIVLEDTPIVATLLRIFIEHAGISTVIVLETLEKLIDGTAFDPETQRVVLLSTDGEYPERDEEFPTDEISGHKAIRYALDTMQLRTEQILLITAKYADDPGIPGEGIRYAKERGVSVIQKPPAMTDIVAQVKRAIATID